MRISCRELFKKLIHFPLLANSYSHYCHLLWTTQKISNKIQTYAIQTQEINITSIYQMLALPEIRKEGNVQESHY
jgi:hypothetical protein